MQVGWVKIGDLRHITHYKSKMSTVASVVNLVRSQIYAVVYAYYKVLLNEFKID